MAHIAFFVVWKTQKYLQLFVTKMAQTGFFAFDANVFWYYFSFHDERRIRNLMMTMKINLLIDAIT